MKFAATFIFSFLTTLSFAQTKKLSTLPKYDCNPKELMAIIGKPTILVMPDDNIELQSITSEYCGDLGNNCIQKTVSEIKDTDYSKPFFIVGEIDKIKNWSSFNLPVKKLAEGFEINNKRFVDASDGFAFIDANHIIVSGNSLQALKDVQLAFSGGYNITILEKGKITFFGNYQSGKFDWYNLQNLKTENYYRKNLVLFSKVYLSKTFPDSIDFSKTETELKKYSAQFLSVYKISMPAKKIDWFIHSNMQEYGTMSGMFGLTCSGNNSAGFSIRGEIHTNGFDLGLVKHEYSHYLFDNSISQENNPAFFIEGCVEYMTDLNDTSLYKERLTIAKKYKDTLNFADLIINNKDFYGQYSGKNYSVCGVFVKYIIDNFGVDTFKEYCFAKDKTVATKKLFKKDFLELLQGYKTWLDAQ
jgi:hypothetical protein